MEKSHSVVFSRFLLFCFCVLASQNACAENAPQAAHGRQKKIIIKFRDDYSAGAVAAHLFNTSQRFEKITGHSGMDTFNRMYNVTHMKRLFQDFEAEPVTMTRTIRRSDAAVLHARARQKYEEKVRKIMNKRLAGTKHLNAGQAAAVPYLNNIYAIDVETDESIETICAGYASLPEIAYAQPAYKVQAQFEPNDPYYSTSGSWGQAYDDLWGLKTIGASAAWDITLGAGVVVAVVDTGVDYTHPDLAENIWTNAGEVAGNGIDDDNNGFIDDVRGWDLHNSDADPMDDRGHGTHVAGTIAAVGNNGIGIIGVAPSAAIMPVKCLDSAGLGDSGTVAIGIIYAANNGADVINNSLGCTSACPSDPVAEDAVRYAYAMGAAVVFAAGNSNADVARYSPQNQPESITVAATTETDAKSSFSNHGTWIDIAAPGSGESISPPAYQPIYNILSLRAQNTGDSNLVVSSSYVRQAGTSMAAPHVSGVAALIVSAHPEYSVEQIRQALRKGSDDILAPGYDLQSGYGRLNAYKALALTAPLEVRITSPIAQNMRRGTNANTIDVRGTVNGAALASWELEYGAGESPTTWTTIAEGTNAIESGVLGTLSLDTMPDGFYTLLLRGMTSSGETYEDRRLVSTFAADANWSALGSGMDGSVYALAADAAGTVYAGGNFTTAGGVTVNGIAKWDGAGWSALGSGMGGSYPCVFALAVDAAGNLYAGGWFTTAGGITVNNIAKWNGSSWSALGSGMTSYVYALALDAPGNLYAGGPFTTAGGAAANHIAKWNGSGWSALGSGMNGDVSAIVLDPSGTVYAGGNFSTAGGVTANRIAKWDGSSWSALGAGMGFSDVNALAVDTSGNLFAGGNFTTAGGVATSNIANWDGSSWSALGSGMNTSVFALSVDAAGDLYAGGQFTTAGGAAANYIAKWDGAGWSALGSGVEDISGWSRSVAALVIDASNYLNVGGGFTTAGGDSANYIARYCNVPELVIKHDGDFSYTVAGGTAVTIVGYTGPGGAVVVPDYINSMPVVSIGINAFRNITGIVSIRLPDTIASIGDNAFNGCSGLNAAFFYGAAPAMGVGVFDNCASGFTVYYLAGAAGFSNPWYEFPAVMLDSFPTTTSSIITTSTTSSSIITTSTSSSSTTTTSITTTSTSSVSSTTTTHAADANWSALGSGMNSSVNALAVDAAGNLYAGGNFTTAGGITANRIAKWNGSGWTALGSGMNGPVSTLAVDSSGTLYAGGGFTTAGGIPVKGIAKWDGASWSALGSGISEASSYVNRLAKDEAGNLYAGWVITTNGVTTSSIAKWDGMSWSVLGSEINGTISALVVDGSGNLYAGGSFTTAGGVSTRYIATWNGTNWSALGSGMGGGYPYVKSLAVDATGSLYAGGYFTTAGGTVANRIATWNGTSWSALGSGMSFVVFALVVDAAGNLYAGGDFATAGGVPVNYIAKWDGSSWSALGSGMSSLVNALAHDTAGNLYVGGSFTTVGGKPAQYIARYRIDNFPSTTTAATSSSTTTASATSSSTTTAAAVSTTTTGMPPATTTTTAADVDHDGIADSADNCPAISNPLQGDVDGDKIGDVCDTDPGCGGCGLPACEVSPDKDGDGIANASDNCPNTCNPRQLDADGDGIGDVCDSTPGCGGCGLPACETWLVEPELGQIGGVFGKSPGAKLQIWVTADARRLPVMAVHLTLTGPPLHL